MSAFPCGFISLCYPIFGTATPLTLRNVMLMQELVVYGVVSFRLLLVA
jgi:hypothetical protein